MASQKHGSLYVGVTSDLARRSCREHREGLVDVFRSAIEEASCYAEWHDTIEAAILRENQIKEWKRDWTIRLIEEQNPDWSDLHTDVITWLKRRPGEGRGPSTPAA